jgi:class 3 adenylate cyclase
MEVALARHDALQREAIRAHGGSVFKAIGDPCCAACPTAPVALVLCQRRFDRISDAQRSLETTYHFYLDGLLAAALARSASSPQPVRTPRRRKNRPPPADMAGSCCGTVPDAWVRR